MNRSRGIVVFDNGKSIAATRLSRPLCGLNLATTTREAYLTDPFKDELERIAREAKNRHERETKERAVRGRQFRDNVEDAFKTAVAFNNRVITPILVDFSASVQDASEFECEFKESESQPEFVHVCNLAGRRLEVSLLYWIAGSARLTCGFGYGHKEDAFKIESFDEPDLDQRVQDWLKTELLNNYRSHLDRHPPADDAKQ